jgi:uncharacterized protein YdeI (YjbR/CyaY-like superfamily)
MAIQTHDPLFFKSKTEAVAWFKKNHLKKEQQWLGFFKKNSLKSLFSADDVKDLALCYGWTVVVVKSIDYFSYQMLFIKRKEKSAWSLKVIKRFKELKKQGLIQKHGQWAFDHRDQKKTEKKKILFTDKQLRTFKKNKKAWNFFEAQTPGYKKYMTYWVTTAVRAETQEQRLAELISDSENQTKLKRVLKSQERLVENKKNKYAATGTSIEEAKNLGPLTGSEFRTLGIETVEQLKSLGWEKALLKWINHYPHRLHLMAGYAVIGAVHDQAYKKLDPEYKAEIKNFIKELKADFR